MKFIKLFENYKKEDSKFLYEIMDYPEQDESIWLYIDDEDFENQAYKIVEINPVEWFKTHKVDDSSTIEDVYNDYALDEQKELVKKYRKNIKKIKNDYLVIFKDKLIDGFHRLTALALEGIDKVKALDLYQPVEKNKNKYKKHYIYGSESIIGFTDEKTFNIALNKFKNEKGYIDIRDMDGKFLFRSNDKNITFNDIIKYIS